MVVPENASGSTESISSLPSIDPEQIHRQNLLNIMQQEEQQAMGKLYYHRQAMGKRYAERLARMGPKGNLQVIIPAEKGPQSKKFARRANILDNTDLFKIASTASEDSKSQPQIEPGLEKVPIKIDLELDGYKLRDSIIWCLGDCSITPEDFAAITCEDFELPQGLFVPAIAKTINEQLAEYQDFLGMLKMMGGLKEFVGIRGLIRVECWDNIP